MSVYPDLPFVHALGDGGARSVSQVVVIHATDNTAGASAEANYARTRPDKTSAHFYVDDGAVIQALDTGRIAYGCLYHGNHISVQFELCGRSNQISDATMRRAAPVVARVCREFGIPIRTVDAAGVRSGVKGICGHDAITAAFPEDNGDHTDPGGAFPWATFISYVTGGPDMEEFERKAGNADVQANAILNDYDTVTIKLANGADFSVANKAKANRKAEIAALQAATGQSTVVLSQADRDAIVAALLNSVPTAAQIADELAKRLGNG